MQKIYIIIGASAAGVAAIQKIRLADVMARILCFSEEVEFPYNKCFLADFLAQEKNVSDVYLKSENFFESLSVELYLGTKIVAIDRKAKVISCSKGNSYTYTTLLLAVGGASRNISCFQKNVYGIFPFYTLYNALAVEEWIKKQKPKNILVMGAGLTGLEVADALRVYGVNIIVVEQQSRLLMRHSDLEGARFINSAMERFSVQLILGVGVKEILSDQNNHVAEVVFTDGTSKKIDMVIGALGSCARLELAESAGLAIEQGAVVTNEYLQTNDPAIFAAGDVTLVKNRITGEMVRTALWPDAVAQGMYAGSSMAGQMRVYPGIVPIATSTFFEISFHSGGFLEMHNNNWSEKIERTPSGYAKVILDQAGVVKGFICLGDLVCYMVSYKRSLVTGMSLA